MQIRRCTTLFFELRDDAVFDLARLLAGGDGVNRRTRWLALAPHLDGDVEVSKDEREWLGGLSPSRWHRIDQMQPLPFQVERLIEQGLVVSDQPEHVQHRRNDECVQQQRWWPLAALWHRSARWRGEDSVATMEAHGLTTAEGMVGRLGAPPAEIVDRGEGGIEARIALPRSTPGTFDELLSRRVTCRNFDTQRPLSHSLLGQMLERSVMASARIEVGHDTAFLKKPVPSGGSLHPTETYLLVQRVEGMTSGLYHYRPVDHALQPLQSPPQPLAEFARRAVSGQHWFADAPVLVILVPRFLRSFWKYRNHAKAYRAMILDVGHIAQTLYLSATDLGLGAFVTSAINEVDIEQALGLDGLQDGPLAICGFGWRGEEMNNTELDPGGAVWPAGLDSEAAKDIAPH
ncbi:putative peptide maturation dehydrogenase [Xanthomonas arboricola pv. juglandis]|jgi:putative peptide maturation dehydrogenase|uniref:putative peptide maturation dehydrogenase n=1 Tax=Xanthomonas TaxID=338 RepID=UPI000CEF4ED0|nr:MULTISPECIES: putative peptide maturation dehydrogenase [Xanthomonas]PPT30775.1 putative peptide maturation dehydrogenase [Xanthomonas arboricola]SYZ55376.1 putative peptide maturation dehydrogenase [Xanthomonas arboricola pv. juglandis]MBB5766328.1 putative peptide maturation dehydrogenase [Xanthomonas euroxanthea]NIJ93418.1 putative peptide maturation dehydrogenase [Xanthomonas euroxanthea]CAD1786464.1 putative peptide maturation dehydrogenase [Xanthomonas sp. CPBF 426]